MAAKKKSAKRPASRPMGKLTERQSNWNRAIDEGRPDVIRDFAARDPQGARSGMYKWMETEAENTRRTQQRKSGRSGSKSKASAKRSGKRSRGRRR